MLVFNLQTWQQALFEMDKMTPHALSKMIGYPVYLIWLPIFISGCLVLLNIYRSVRRIFSYAKQNKTGRNRLNPVSACFLNSNAYRSLVLAVAGIHNRE